MVPAGPAGTVDVTVTNVTGTSALASADRFTYSAASVPSVSSISPTSGGTGGSTVVTISGSNLTGATAVTFGTLAATSFSLMNSSTIVATAPAQAAATVHITVTTPTGTSAVGTPDQFTYSAATAPSVSGVSPTSGGTGGGTVVTISGSNFTGASAVSFGTLAASSFTVTSSSQVIATAPPQAAGTYHITVTTPSGTSSTSSSDQITYSAASAPSVSGVTPSSGTSAGGTAVVVLGSNFTGASAVSFGSTAASSFVVNSATSITAIAPAGTAGTVHITVTTPSGTSSTSSADQYTYTGSTAPTVTARSPTSGGTGGGTAVTLTGTGFTSAMGVWFGSLPATAFAVISDTSLVAVAPPQAAATVDITVINNIGTSSTSSSDQFTYNTASAPTVTAVSPTSGTTAGGGLATVTGTNFIGASGVSFGSTAAASFTILSDTTIVATAPAQASGTQHITVTTPSGTSSTSSSDQYTVSNATAPSVSAIAPSSGSTGGGTVVYVSGSNFTGATGVSFGATAAASFTVLSDVLLQATAPAKSAGTYHITVTTYAGTSSTVSADQFTYNAASVPSVSQVSPTEGSTAGGNVVTILGANFTGATGVSFGGTAATAFTVVSDGAITATAPARSAGTVDMTVTTYAGTSSTSSADQYTYATAPTVTGISPSTGPTSGGTTVTITGTNFFATVWVYFGTALATSVTYTSSTQISAVSPAGSAGTVHIVVQTEVGTSATSSSDQFTYTSPLLFAGSAVAAPKGHLTMSRVKPLLLEAIHRWSVAGINSRSELTTLRQVRVKITDLPDNLLGMAAGKVIWIDQNAAGHGWYVDATPRSDSEFRIVVSNHEMQARADSRAADKVDLLSVLAHELGHVLGLEHGEAQELMAPALALGVRLLPEGPDWAAALEERGSLKEHGQQPGKAEPRLRALVDRVFRDLAAQEDPANLERWLRLGLIKIGRAAKSTRGAR